MTTKQLIKDVSDIKDSVSETHNDMHTYMNDIGHMVKENSYKIDNIDISCDCNREIRNLTDFVEKETTDISNDITNLKDNIEDWIDDSRTTLQESLSNELDSIHDEITNRLDTIHDAIDTIAQEQDKLKDDIKDIREKLGEILTILHSLPK